MQPVTMKAIVIFCFIGLAICAPPKVSEETTHHVLQNVTTSVPETTTEIEVGEYFLNDPAEPETQCIKAKFNAQITLSYPTSEGGERNASISVPSDSKTRGECENFIELTWFSLASLRSDTNLTENTLRLDVARDAEKDVYYVSAVSFSLLRDDVVLPEIAPGPPLTGKMSNLREFETSTSNSYSCSESKLSDSFEVTFSNMQFEAYNENAGSDFKTAMACRVTIDGRTDPYRNANHVGIAVGVSIGVLILVALGAVLISRYRKRRKAAAAAFINTDTTYQQFDN